MEKPNISRSIIHTISKFSNWNAEGIDSFFRNKGIYANRTQWNTFIRLLLIGGGVAFLVSGIIFFFAFNWASLHKFAKLGLVQGLIVAIVTATLLIKTDEKIKGIVLTGATMLVGALFAVFGQIYQTGANAYDFFLGWTLFVALWVFVSNFPPLWLVFLTLINTTILMYMDQVVMNWSGHHLAVILFVVNVGSFLLLKMLEGKKLVQHVPNWLERIIMLFSLSALTMSFISGIFDRGEQPGWVIAVLMTLASYVVGLWYGFQKKDTFYIAIIGFSAIMIGTALIVRMMNDLDGGIFFLVGFFVVGSISALVIQIISLNKKWYGSCLLYTSPSPRDATLSRMPSSA